MSPYRLHASIGYQLSVTARLQEKRFDDMLKTLGLTRTSWCVLLGVVIEGLSRPSDIARFIGIDRTALSRALRQMEAAKLITRKGGTGDRRTTQVTATDKGRRLLDQATPMAVENAAIMDSRLSAQEARDIRRLLAKLRGDEPLSLNRI